MIHNETVNVWSHLLGALFFIYLGGLVWSYMAPSTLEDKSTLERWATSFDIGKLNLDICLAEPSEKRLSLPKEMCPLDDTHELLDDLLRSP